MIRRNESLSHANAKGEAAARSRGRSRRARSRRLFATQHEEPYDWRRQVRGVTMGTQHDPPTKIAELPLTAFELPTWLVEPAVRSCRLFNTALDFIFYDVPTLRAALAEKDAPMQAGGEKPPSRII